MACRSPIEPGSRLRNEGAPGRLDLVAFESVTNNALGLEFEDLLV